MNGGDAQAERAALAKVDDDETLAFLQRMVAVSSANPPGDEDGVAKLISDVLAAEGIPARLDEVYPRRSNAVASLGPSGGPILLLNGHTDTMPAGTGWNTDPSEGVVRGGRVYGLGVCDMKGGLAAMVQALLAVKRARIPLRGRVLLDAVIDEEAYGAGTRRTLERGLRADWAIICEPTSLLVARIGAGQITFEIVFHGEAAHASMPETGHSAIYDASSFVVAVEKQGVRMAKTLSPLIGPATYSVGTIKGGLQTSIVPSECVVTVDRRILPGQSLADATGDIDALLDGVRGARGAERRTIIAIPPFETPEAASVCQVLREATRQVTGDSAFGGLRGTTDAATLADAGIPTVVFGPGSLQEAHQPNEFIPIDELNAASRVLTLSIVRLLGA
jgi:acetylornithine deacetylase/succinyl-diaminopimelate desuccinylase family protein